MIPMMFPKIREQVESFPNDFISYSNQIENFQNLFIANSSKSLYRPLYLVTNRLTTSKIICDFFKISSECPSTTRWFPWCFWRFENNSRVSRMILFHIQIRLKIFKICSLQIPQNCYNVLCTWLPTDELLQK